MKKSAQSYHHGNLREALLRVAEEVVEREGEKALTLRELSRELGVSHTSPLRHFANKQALLDALAMRGFERMDAALGRAVKDRGKGFAGRLTALARAYVGFQLKHPALCAMMFDAKHRPDAPRDLLETAERAYSHGPDIFAEGQASGEVAKGDPARLCLVVFVALQGLVAISTNGKFKGVSLDVLVPETVEMIVAGLGSKKQRGKGQK